MFEKRTFFEQAFERILCRLNAVEEHIAERIAAKIRATDPGCYYCGAIFVGKSFSGEPIVMSQGAWLDDRGHGQRTILPMSPVVELRRGGFVFVQGPCLITDVRVGYLSQIGQSTGAGMPLCYVHDPIPLGSQLLVNIERLTHPKVKGW